MAEYTRKYRYNGGDGLYYHSNQEIAWGATGWSIVEGDTTHNIANILSITAYVVVNRHSSSSDRSCRWSCRLNFSDGKNITSNVATGNISSAGDNSGRTVTFSASDVATVKNSWNYLSTVTSIVGGGSWTNWKKHPLYLTITFNDEFYGPSINKFTVERCDTNGVLDPQNGVYLKITTNLNTLKTTEDAEEPSDITIMWSNTDNKVLADGYEAINSTTNKWLGYDKITLSKSISGFPTFPVSNGYTFTLIFRYHGEIQIATSSISPGLYNFYLSGKPTGGVSIGKKSSATLGYPSFECVYPASFYGGIEGVTNYILNEISTGGTWLDGKPIYRKIFTFNATAGTNKTASGTGLPITGIDMVVRIEGIAKWPTNSTYVPLNYYAGSSQYTAIWFSGGNIMYSSSSACEITAVLYYTKNSST